MTKGIGTKKRVMGRAISVALEAPWLMCSRLEEYQCLVVTIAWAGPIEPLFR